MAPIVRQVVLDTSNPRQLAEFYRQLLGYQYRAGDEPPTSGHDDPRGRDWLVLRGPDGGAGLAFQYVADLPRAIWPDGPIPQQLHLDCTVTSVDDLHRECDRALRLGATMLLDRSADSDEPLYVFADPAGHPLCVFVGQPVQKP